MYLTMNRFKVKPDAEAEFEAVWLNRESKLTEVPGFVEFHMLRGPERDGHRLYASHTAWDSKESFEAWTKSSAFRGSHAGVKKTEGEAQKRPISDMLVGGNELDIFESFQHIKA